MMMPRTTHLLVTLALVSLAASGCRGMVSSEPPIHFQHNMDQQDRFEGQEPNDFFADGRAARQYVDGTVPARRVVGQTLDCIKTWEDAHRCTGKTGEEWATTLPMDADADLLARGRERYDIYCAPCHDTAGAGKGPVVQANAGLIPPPTYHDDRVRGMAMGQLFNIISDGVRNMPGYGKQIPVDDRWAIAAHVRVLQYSQNASISDVDKDVKSARGWE
jgi:mono/diheme cytochrome c family protein